MILPIFKGVLVCGVILGFLPFGLSSMTIRHLSMINSMNAILFFALEDNFTSRDLVSNNETYTSLALQDNFSSGIHFK
jgi:hypothetical protein